MGKNSFSIFLLCLLILTAACSKSDIDDGDYSGDEYTGEPTGNNGNNGGEGQITAGEWNDLNNWSFWDSLINSQEYFEMQEYWSMFTNNRVEVQLKYNDLPVVNAMVELQRNGSSIWKARSDNMGFAQLWVGSYQLEEEEEIDLNQFNLLVDGEMIDIIPILYEDGNNNVELPYNNVLSRVELCFVVDATGSMSDELEFLKDDLQDVIERVEDDNPISQIFTSTVFYRDEGDEYVYKVSHFTDDINATVEFIEQQSASGGGDFPEAVHTALNAGINELQWSENAKTRIIFLLLDAPPHYAGEIVADIQELISDAARYGIKIIPITASGIDKQTEFLMRFMSVFTNGTYVFITDDSGIGHDHLEPTVGEYQVEYLNDLLVRLIIENTE